MTDKETPVAAIFFFNIFFKNIPSQDFVMGNISCEFEISTYNTLCSRGPTKVLAESEKNAHGGHLLFQNGAKNISRQDFMVINISCKSGKGSYNIFFIKCESISKKAKNGLGQVLRLSVDDLQ